MYAMYGMRWNGMERYGTVRYGTAWYVMQCPMNRMRLHHGFAYDLLSHLGRKAWKAGKEDAGTVGDGPK